MKISKSRLKQIIKEELEAVVNEEDCLLYTSPSPRDRG